MRHSRGARHSEGDEDAFANSDYRLLHRFAVRSCKAFRSAYSWKETAVAASLCDAIVGQCDRQGDSSRGIFAYGACLIQSERLGGKI